MNDLSIEKVNGEFVKVAKKHNLDPVWLKEIIRLRNRGFNNTGIAQRMGIARQTVSRYVEALRNVDERDYLTLIVGAFLLVAGIALVIDHFK